MKTIFSSFLCLFLLIQASAQNLDFTLADPQPDIFEVYWGSAVFGDLDSDGDIDLVQSGLGENLTGQNAEVSVFLNDGDGNFSLTVQNFNDYFTTERAVSEDLDGDDDLDLIISAGNGTDFYRNDGQALFALEPNAPFMDSDDGDVIIGDIDNDGDNDVLQYGSLSQSNLFTALFLNDGDGNFTEVTDMPFEPYLNARTEFIDLENDGDIDVLSFGRDANDDIQVSVYENNGEGVFTLFSGSEISPHAAEEISVGDIDNDGDEDFLITGLSPDSGPQTLLYLNSGSGQFLPLLDSSFPDLFAGSSAFSDLDNDNDLDILLIGSAAGGLPNIFSIVFENLGGNNFIAADSLGGEYIPAQGIADLNGDGWKDILIQGFVDDTNVYLNTTPTSTGLMEIESASISVFPNPSNGVFQVHWDESVEFSLLEVFDRQGKVVYTEPVTFQGLMNVHLDLAPGIYSVQFIGGHSRATRGIALFD